MNKYITDGEVLCMALGFPTNQSNHMDMNSLHEVMETPNSIYGIGDKRSKRIRALKELIERLNVEKEPVRTSVNCPEDVFDYVKMKLAYQETEHFCIVCLNTKNRVIKMKEVSNGSLSASIVHPREVFRKALECNAASIILVHNHPSGDVTPSREDINVTERLVKCGKLMDIPVLDHLIVSLHSFASLKERGLIQ